MLRPLSIIQTLQITHHRQESKDLWLHNQWDRQFLHNTIGSESEGAKGPDEEHGVREALGGLCLVVVDGLREELERPKDDTEHAEDVFED